jgi:peptidoglycan hydrolase-like protein with peptidoglycan-binding domain
MAGTKKFIKASVGVRGTNNREDVRTLQQLLIAAGVAVKGGADGGWGDNTLAALREFLKAQTPPIEKTLIEPASDIPLKIAAKASILIPLPGLPGIAGVEKLHQWFVANNIQYQAGAENGEGNRCVYGVDGQTGYAVQTEAREYRKGPIQMDCTTYTNLMLSVYLYGNAHNTAYDGDCAKVGGTSSFHCARDRYGFKIVSRRDKDKLGKDVTLTDFRTAEQITTAVKENGGGMYALEPAILGSGAVKHLALLHSENVYECTNAFSLNCIKHSLTEFMDRCKSKGRFCYLFGPG